MAQTTAPYPSAWSGHHAFPEPAMRLVGELPRASRGRSRGSIYPLDNEPGMNEKSGSE